MVPSGPADAKPTEWANTTGEGSLRRPLSMTSCREQLVTMTKNEAALVKSRENLLVQRQQVRAFAKRLRDKRVMAGDAEATLMSAFRDYINLRRELLPSFLWNAYDEVEVARNDLGVMEDDYLRAESELTSAEWHFMDQETEFYQFDMEDLLREIDEMLISSAKIAPSLSDPPHTDQVNQYGTFFSSLPPPPPPPPPPLFTSRSESTAHPAPFGSSNLPRPPPPPARPFARPHSAVDGGTFLAPPLSCVELNRTLDDTLAKWSDRKDEFDQLRQQRASRINELDESVLAELDDPLDDLLISPSEPEYFGVLDRVLDHEVKLKRLRKEATLRNIDMGRRKSAPHDLGIKPVLPAKTFNTAQSENATRDLEQDHSTLQRIRDWLFNYLTENVVEHALYRKIAKEFGVQHIEKKEWRQLAEEAERYWQTDSPIKAIGHVEQSGVANNGYGMIGYQYQQVSDEEHSVYSLQPQHLLEQNTLKNEDEKQPALLVDESEASTTLEHQTFFETFITDLQTDEKSGAVIQPSVVTVANPALPAPEIVFRPSSPPPRMDSPQTSYVDRANTGTHRSNSPAKLYNSLDKEEPPTDHAPKEKKKSTWLCIDPPVTEQSVDREVAAECLEYIPSVGQSASDEAHATGSWRSEGEQDRSSIFDIFSRRPRSVSDSHRSVDRTGGRYRLQPRHKRNLKVPTQQL